MRFALRVSTLALFLFVSCSAQRHSPQAKAAVDPNETGGYRLVWADEFNVDGPPGTKDWIFEEGLIRNHEAQWYQADNARCSGGMLVIEARRQPKSNPNYVAGSPSWQSNRQQSDYTSAAIETRGKHAWMYGRFVLRARIDTHAGSWPAFWMMGESGGWPGCGEVDIMEYYRNVLLANVGWKGLGANGTSWNTGRKPLEQLPANWSSQFHVWRMDWDENSIKLYCDDHLLNTQDLSQALNPDGNCPFHQPAYLLLNQAIGGDCGGDPSQTSFPLRYEIDYVRVYQKPQQSGN